MVNYFIYAKDFSGSTNGVVYFHSNGLKTLEQFDKEVEEIKAEEPSADSRIIYLHWGDKCFEVARVEAGNAYTERRCGYMGTKPECIIKLLKGDYTLGKDDKIKLLYIITDGMTDRGSTDKCFELNEDMDYEKVVFHAINENLNSIDLSVATSFFKSRCVVYRNNELYEQTDISKEFDYDGVNVDNFSEEKDHLKSYIMLKFIRKFQRDASALREIDKLKKLRGRLFEELESKTSRSKVDLETTDRDEFIRRFTNTDWYRNLTSSGFEEKVDIEKSITTLINYIVSDVKSYSFDALKFDQKFNKVVEEQEIDVKFCPEPEQEVEFPDVILDDEKGVPVVLLAKFNLMDKIILHKEVAQQVLQEVPQQVPAASFSKFKSTMECPLFLVKDKDVKESIGYFYTLNVYKQLLANNMKSEPRSRRAVHGGLVLIDQFDKYNDYILSATYFNSKKVDFNIGLFYYVLWKSCASNEWMDKNVLEQFKKYAMRRISKTVCKLGLSSLPLDPQENTSLLTALWYCVDLSSSIFKNDPRFFKHERLRGFHSVAKYMIEILTYFNYDLNLKSIERRRELINQVMTLKKIQKPRDKLYYLLEKIFKTSEGFLISEIEKPFNLYQLNYLKLDHKEMLPDEIVEGEVHLNDYIHLLYLDTSETTFEICGKTFRPFFTIDLNKSFYSELFKNTKKTVINNDGDKDTIEVAYEDVDSLEFPKILSLYKLFIDCVKDSEEYPTLQEFLAYVSKRKKFYQDLVTVFPAKVGFAVEDVHNQYQEIVKKVDVREFIKVCESHVKRIDRIKAEGRVEFGSDNEISKFISGEELRVKLKKTT